MNRISELTGLDLGSFDDRLLLYIALQLDGATIGRRDKNAGRRFALPGLEDAWRKRQIILVARSGGAPPGTLSLTGKFFQIGFDFADLIG